MQKNKIIFSIVIPLYNEELAVKKVLCGVVKELEKIKTTYEIIAVDNGSTDNTNNILMKLTKKFPVIKILSIRVNEGYGNGISQGLKIAKGSIIGYMDGDGQVLNNNLIECLKTIKNEPIIDFIKVIRVERNDGGQRTIISGYYNYFIKKIFNIKQLDINAKPKFFRRSVYNKIKPIDSKDWFIDTEIVLKINRLKILCSVIPVVFSKREKGKSKVKIFLTIVEFIKNILIYKMRGY